MGVPAEAPQLDNGNRFSIVKKLASRLFQTNLYLSLRPEIGGRKGEMPDP